MNGARFRCRDGHDCGRFGLDWTSQHRKLTDLNSNWGIVSMTIPTAGGLQEMTCPALMDFPLWLASISPSKVGHDVKMALKLYRREAHRVLWEHRVGRAQRKEPQRQILAALVKASNPLWNHISRRQEAGVPRWAVRSLLR